MGKHLHREINAFLQMGHIINGKRDLRNNLGKQVLVVVGVQTQVGDLEQAEFGEGESGAMRESSDLPRCSLLSLSLTQPTFFDHPHSQTLLKSAVLTAIPAPLVHGAVFIC